MDNLDEAKSMLGEEYQLKCARAIDKGICRFFNIECKEKSENLPSKWAKDDWEWVLKMELQMELIHRVFQQEGKCHD